jgi:hypothetical protein
MKKIGFAFLSFVLLNAVLQSCKKEVVQVVDFTSITPTDNECRITGTFDTTQWNNSVLNRQTDTVLLVFGDNIVITDSICGNITISPPCPNPSNGFFIWNVNPSRQCKLKVVCVNTAYDILYYNAYALNGGPITLGFDFRAQTAFRTDSNYRMFYAFYNSRDSVYYSGHGDIKIVKP